MIRRLDESDFNRIFEIFQSNSKFQGSTKFDSFTRSIDDLWFQAHSHRIKDESFIYIGYFRDDKLIAFVQGETWQRQGAKVASIGWTLRDKSYELTKSYDQPYWSHEIVLIENALIDTFLEKAVTKIYCTVAVNSLSSQNMPNSRLQLFKRSVLEIVPAGKQCNDLELRQHIYGNLTLNKDQELVVYYT